MGVRLNKVLSELNIGFETAVEFLKKRNELGEIKDDATPNTKITDDQYDALVNEFSTDKAVKTKAEQLFVKKVKEKKAEKTAGSASRPEKAVAPSDELLEHRPQFKAVGKIDLDSIGKVKVKPEASQEDSPHVGSLTEGPQPDEQPEAMPEPAPEDLGPEEQSSVAEVQPEPVETVEPAAVEVDNEAQEEPAPLVEEEAAPAVQQSASLAKTPGDLKAAQNAPQLNVVGKIDLDSLNQSTRPKKKSKEERRKEREETAAGERKKRERIRQGRVDIEAAAKQAGKNDKKNKPNGGNGNQQNQQQQQGGGKKNKKNRPVKPLEVDDEAVARQVKETLARLTSKTNQNKKGAKYRKEKRDAVQERMSEEMAAEAA